MGNYNSIIKNKLVTKPNKSPSRSANESSTQNHYTLLRDQDDHAMSIYSIYLIQIFSNLFWGSIADQNSYDTIAILLSVFTVK